MGFAMKLDLCVWVCVCGFPSILVHGAPLLQTGHLAIQQYKQSQSFMHTYKPTYRSYLQLCQLHSIGHTERRKEGRKEAEETEEEEEKEVRHEKNATSERSFGHAQLV